MHDPLGSRSQISLPLPLMGAPKNDPFTRRVLEVKGKNKICLICKTSIAELFGWDTAFPEWSPPIHIRPDGSQFFYVSRKLMGENPYRGGHGIYISRAPSKTGHPGGKTHRFRLIGPWAKRHQVQLAEIAGEKFQWMEDRQGRRVSREKWLA